MLETTVFCEPLIFWEPVILNFFHLNEVQRLDQLTPIAENILDGGEINDKINRWVDHIM